jgi:hypothetical protein
MEPKPVSKNVASSGKFNQTRGVPMVISLDWAQVLTRQQQLLNESASSNVYLRIYRDEGGLVRIDLND